MVNGNDTFTSTVNEQNTKQKIMAIHCFDGL